MDNQSLRYIRDDMLEDFRYSLVRKSTQPDHWFPCTDCLVRKAMDGKDFQRLELKIIGSLVKWFEGGI